MCSPSQLFFGTSFPLKTFKKLVKIEQFLKREMFCNKKPNLKEAELPT